MTENMKDVQKRVLKDTVMKHEHGTVYGNLNGVNANHDFKKYPINENYSLEDYVSYLEKTIVNLHKTNEIFKEAILQNEKRISTLEKKIDKYGII